MEDKVIMTLDEYRKILLDEEIAKREKIREALLSGKQEEASVIIAFRCGNWEHESQRMLLDYANDFEDHGILFQLILDVYTNDGYNFPKKLIKLEKRISKEIPEEKRLEGLPDGDPVTIWRGVVDIATRTDISWTIDKKTAIWFANRYRSCGKGGTVWEATIPRDKIIAYTNERNEREILQYMNVRNVHMLEISEEEWNKALSECKEERKKKS